MNNGVNYTIISRPSYITFECPFCHEEVEVNFDEVDFNTDYWGDGAWCDCPECGEEVELDDYEYDQENNMADRQTKTIQWTINLPMNFPSDWDDDMIEFHLNESSWCCSNLINELEKYDEKNGCICGICEAKVVEKIGGMK